MEKLLSKEWTSAELGRMLDRILHAQLAGHLDPNETGKALLDDARRLVQRNRAQDMTESKSRYVYGE